MVSCFGDLALTYFHAYFQARGRVEGMHEY